MQTEHFEYGVMLGYMEVLGVAVCSYGERALIAKEHGRVAPLSAYPLLMLLLMTSSALSNMSLNYINFPTKVVFRSCKLIPTMLVAKLLHNKRFPTTEYMCALAVCVGLVLFAAADWDTSPSFHPIGLGMVTMSVCADAILPNAQEKLFQMGASRLEVQAFTNWFTLVAMTITTLLSGDLLGALEHTRRSRQLQLYWLVYTFVAYIAISVHMMVVKKFGGVTAVLVATGRKGMTLVVSFILFPKGFSWYYPVGASLVLGGLAAVSVMRIRSKQQRLASTTPSMNGVELKPLITNKKTMKHHQSDIESPPASRRRGT